MRNECLFNINSSHKKLQFKTTELFYCMQDYPYNLLHVIFPLNEGGYINKRITGIPKHRMIYWKGYFSVSIQGVLLSEVQSKLLLLVKNFHPSSIFPSGSLETSGYILLYNRINLIRSNCFSLRKQHRIFFKRFR